jgi:hypothetical protein
MISPSQSQCLHRATQHWKTRTNIHVLSWIQTHDPSVPATTVTGINHTTHNVTLYTMAYTLFINVNRSANLMWNELLIQKQFKSLSTFQSLVPLFPNKVCLYCLPGMSMSDLPLSVSFVSKTSVILRVHFRNIDLLHLYFISEQLTHQIFLREGRCRNNKRIECISCIVLHYLLLLITVTESHSYS